MLYFYHSSGSVKDAFEGNKNKAKKVMTVLQASKLERMISSTGSNKEGTNSRDAKLVKSKKCEGGSTQQHWKLVT